MTLEDEYKLLIGAYYGVKSLDEYDLKEYLLSDIRKLIDGFISSNKLGNYDYKEMEEVYNKELSLRTKLQDALLVLHDMNAPMEVILLIRAKLKEEKKYWLIIGIFV